MTLAITYSRANIGIEAPLVSVETHISSGLPCLNIVGLPEKAVKESKDRVRSAILNSHFEFPNRRITVNLAPAELPKQGGRYDLSIAIGILAASKQIPHDELLHFEFLGELALTGELRPVTSILPLVIATRKAKKNLILAYPNLEEASLITDAALFPAKNLLEVSAHFLNKKSLLQHAPIPYNPTPPSYPDLKQVHGQHHAKRALEIAAAGQHSLLLLGPPGVGKTLLSHCLPGILPPMTEPEAFDLATIQSLAGINITPDNWGRRPFRAPHHSASSYALIGGGNPPQPGEISLAHHGVLFLDELPEFKRQSLEALREPLETGVISISRANAKILFPARFQLITAMNPCPCGHYGSAQNECLCPPTSIQRYQAKVSGPLLDRIDMQAELQPLPSLVLTNPLTNTESSHTVSKRVQLAREFQYARAEKPNAMLSNKEIELFCKLNSTDKILIEKLINQYKLSARSYHKILKVALTIADLAQACSVSSSHLKEALSFRFFDKLKRM